MKYLLLKTGNWDKFKAALLEWRQVPRSLGDKSPSQLFLGRNQHSVLPVYKLNPLPTFLKLSTGIRTRDAQRVSRELYHPQKSGGNDLSILQVGQHVRMQNMDNLGRGRWDQKGVVTQKRRFNRSYEVFSEGKIFIRNRRFLRAIDLGPSDTSEKAPPKPQKLKPNFNLSTNREKTQLESMHKSCLKPDAINSDAISSLRRSVRLSNKKKRVRFC